jgi:predicted metalloprotease with PDZ domain
MAAADELEALVGKLASEEFKAREEASAELVRRGRENPPLIQALCLRGYLTSRDPEIRLRAKAVLRELLTESYGFLGVRHRAAEYFDEAGETRKGVEIMAVEEGHAAQAAAMQVGDIVTAMDGKAFDEAAPADDFSRRIRLLGAGRKTVLKVERAGQVITIPLTTGPAPKNLVGQDSEARFQEWLKAQAESKPPQ